MSAGGEDLILVFTSLPDRDCAQRLARILVETRAAACVNILAACASVYRWQGRIENADEVPMLIKTRVARYPQVEQTIRAHHPYELPEVLCVPVSAGWPAYLQWVVDETSTSS
jgi:periplasmic divalent cation tolerance protein